MSQLKHSCLQARGLDMQDDTGPCDAVCGLHVALTKSYSCWVGQLMSGDLAPCVAAKANTLVRSMQH